MLDVVVIGAGPAGSTAGHLLAAEGHDVRILDRARFPRFHIGESLLPCNLPLLQRLGMVMSEGPYLCKRGAEFIDERSGDFAFYDFADALPGGPSHAYQVERAVFDHDLLKLALAAGARVDLGVRVLGIDVDEGGVEVVTDGGSLRARYVVDATGQDALLGRRRRALEPIKGLGRAAVFRHYTGLARETCEQLQEQGNIKVIIRDDGWLWIIPLAGARASVGLVSHARALDPAALDAALADSPLGTRLTRDATAGAAWLARNFSYRNGRSRGPRHACVGDAACFLDPVFSSGVALAMLGAERLSDLLSPALREGREAAPDLMLDLEQHMQAAYRSVGALIHSFYNTNLVRNLFFAARPVPELRSGLISILAGDVWRDDNRLQQMLLDSSRRRGPF